MEQPESINWEEYEGMSLRFCPCCGSEATLKNHFANPGHLITHTPFGSVRLVALVCAENIKDKKALPGIAYSFFIHEYAEEELAYRVAKSTEEPMDKLGPESIEFLKKLEEKFDKEDDK